MIWANYSERIGRFNDALNAYVDLTGESGEGLAWAVKSNIAVRGLPLTAGIGAYKDNIAERDAAIVARIRKAGGTVLGTINMHEGALGATTDNLAFGRTYNPWRVGFTPGGSSGGSGAAVAAGLCDIALGSDTMGSVRIPAAYCGVCGHKPSADVLPDDGVLALSPTLDHIGPLARDVATLWQGMTVLADWSGAGPLRAAKLSGLKIGVWSPNAADAMQDDVRANMARALELAEAQGAVLTAFEPPVYHADASRRAGLLISEVEAHAIHAEMLKASPDGFSETFRKMMEWGVRQPAARIDDAYRDVDDIRHAAETLWDTIDIVVAPTAPQTAFSFDEAAPANQANFTAWANFAGLPATAVFAGLSAEGLPTSLQIIGRRGADKHVLSVAAAFEALIGTAPMPAGYE